jgi:hemoglobin
LSLYDELGKERLQQILDAFVDRLFDDLMIGFFFRNADRDRIKQLEFQFTARFLGADIEYAGRPLAEAHRQHPIMGGQFARRLQILRETLEEYRVPPHIREAWIEHTESLRPLITRDKGTDCDPLLARDKVVAMGRED